MYNGIHHGAAAEKKGAVCPDEAVVYRIDTDENNTRHRRALVRPESKSAQGDRAAVRDRLQRTGDAAPAAAGCERAEPERHRQFVRPGRTQHDGPLRLPLHLPRQRAPSGSAAGRRRAVAWSARAMAASAAEYSVQQDDPQQHHARTRPPSRRSSWVWSAMRWTEIRRRAAFGVDLSISLEPLPDPSNRLTLSPPRGWTRWAWPVPISTTTWATTCARAYDKAAHKQLRHIGALFGARSSTSPPRSTPTTTSWAAPSWAVIRERLGGGRKLPRARPCQPVAAGRQRHGPSASVVNSTLTMAALGLKAADAIERAL
jgi:hypothetical protein